MKVQSWGNMEVGGQKCRELYVARMLGACKEVREARDSVSGQAQASPLSSVGGMVSGHVRLGFQTVAPSGLESGLVARTEA